MRQFAFLPSSALPPPSPCWVPSDPNIRYHYSPSPGDCGSSTPTASAAASGANKHVAGELFCMNNACEPICATTDFYTDRHNLGYGSLNMVALIHQEFQTADKSNEIIPLTEKTLQKTAILLIVSTHTHTQSHLPN